MNGDGWYTLRRYPLGSTLLVPAEWRPPAAGPDRDRYRVAHLVVTDDGYVTKDRHGITGPSQEALAFAREHGERVGCPHDAGWQVAGDDDGTNYAVCVACGEPVEPVGKPAR